MNFMEQLRTCSQCHSVHDFRFCLFCGNGNHGHGSWLMVYGSWLVVHGSWLMVHGSWLIDRVIISQTVLSSVLYRGGGWPH